MIGIDVAGWGHHLHPRVQSADESRQCAATRTADGAQTRRIDVRPADEIIERAHRVPYRIAGHAFANQDALCSGVDVLGDGPARQRPIDARITGLLSFALADRVERQYDEALQSEVRRESLPFRF